MKITIEQLRENARKQNERSRIEVAIEQIEKGMFLASLEGEYEYRYEIKYSYKQESVMLIREIQDYFRDKGFCIGYGKYYDEREEETHEFIKISWYE